MFAFNGTTASSTELGRLLAAMVRGRPGRRGRPATRSTNSFIVAIPNAILATAFGTMAALGLQRVGRRCGSAFDALTYMSIIVPEIVIALATLVLFATSFDVVKSHVRRCKLKLRLRRRSSPRTCCSTLSLVLLLVRARLSGMDRTLVEASADLFATPWRTFRQITLPQLLPAIVAGFLLSFTFSFDDFVITTFVVRSRVVDAAAVHLRPGQARRDAGDQRGRDDDAGAYAADAARAVS